MRFRIYSLVALLTVALAATSAGYAQLPGDNSSTQLAAAQAVPVERSSHSNSNASGSSDPSSRGALTYTRRVRGGNGVPEIDPGSMASALTLLMGGTLLLTDRFRRKRGVAATG